VSLNLAHPVHPLLTPEREQHYSLESTWAKPRLPAAGANYSTQRQIRMLYRDWL